MNVTLCKFVTKEKTKVNTEICNSDIHWNIYGKCMMSVIYFEMNKKNKVK